MGRSAAIKNFDERLLYGYLLTLLVGLIMVYSTSSILAESRFGSHYHFLKNQFMWAVISLIAMWIIQKIDLRRFAVYSAPALLVTLLLLSLVFLMEARNGSHRWLFLGPFTVQPSEMFKFLMIVYLAFSLSNAKRDITQLKQGRLLSYPSQPPGYFSWPAQESSIWRWLLFHWLA